MARPKGEVPFNYSTWEKEHRVRFTFKLNKDKDTDLINYLQSKDSTSAYIIDVLRADMANNSKK